MKTTERFLIGHAASQPVSFHMPGHKGSEFYRAHGHGEFLDHILDCDVTEIRGADNLFHDEGILRETAARYAAIYGVKGSFLLVNGTSGGLIASILATVPRGGTLIMARNSHKSVYNGVRLGDIKPEYVYPSVMEGYGITGPVEPAEIEAALQRCPDASAVVLPSPNYYGICSDIKAIADMVHAHGKILIVDQAHGAHLKMMEPLGCLPVSAETSGADIVVASTHKTLASFTQSAVLNLNSSLVSEAALRDQLQIIQSSSPSYLLMASLDINASIIEEEGTGLFRQWMDCVDDFYERVADIPGLESMIGFDLLDRTKLNVDVSGLGLTGHQMADLLADRGVFVELATGNMIMCMTGIGTTREHIERLLEALSEIAAERSGAGALPGRVAIDPGRLMNKRRETFAVDGEPTATPLEKCAGRIAWEAIIPYPPGIPLICRGERIDEDDVAYLQELVRNGHDVLGIDREGNVRCQRK